MISQKRLKDENCKQDEREVGEKRPMLKSPSVHHRENRKSRREKRRQEDKDKEERRIWKLASYNLSHVISRKNFSDKKRCKFLARTKCGEEPRIKSFSTEDEGSDSSEDIDDETTGSDSDDSVTRENWLSQNPISKIRITKGQGFTPKLSFYINNNATFLSLYKYNEWSTKSFDSRLEIMYGGRDNDKQPKELRTEASNYDNPRYPSYGGNLYQHYKSTIQKHKPKVFVEPQRKVSSFAQLNKDDEDNLRKLLELHLSDKELLSLNKSFEEQLSLIKTQKEQLEHITNLENIIKDLTTKLSEQETQIKTINDDNEENKKKFLNGTNDLFMVFGIDPITHLYSNSTGKWKIKKADIATMTSEKQY
ncbi:hypothetical protein RhiirA4_547941 [Rhizophagus irregularis]|uniref:Uncharacterized protein n=1 Tax=Rhizophagus irregularis TaxID=588596 RepID=A0A2I1H4Z6_9GLOM|nr:hypothetical protein RhiirA4_547941 [Rhizophagus irregularis]